MVSIKMDRFIFDLEFNCTKKYKNLEMYFDSV